MLKKLLVDKLRKLQASKNLSDVEFANLLFTSRYRIKENFLGLMDGNSSDTLNDYTSYCQLNLLQDYFNLSHKEIQDLELCNDLSDLRVPILNTSLDQQKIIYILIQNPLKEDTLTEILCKLKSIGVDSE